MSKGELVSNHGKALALTGAFLQLGPIVGLIGTVIGMPRAFNTLGNSGPGIGDPAHLSGAIEKVLISSIVGLALSVVGLVLFCIAFFGCRYRAKWFLACLALSCGLLILYSQPLTTRQDARWACRPEASITACAAPPYDKS